MKSYTGFRLAQGSKYRTLYLSDTDRIQKDTDYLNSISCQGLHLLRSSCIQVRNFRLKEQKGHSSCDQKTRLR